MSRDEEDWSEGLNSFDNIAWSPILDDELPDDAMRISRTHSNKVDPLIPDAPPTTWAWIHHEDHLRVSSRWLRYSSFRHYSGQDGASLLELGADNSQGYQHFYTDYRFHRRGRLAGAWLRLITLLRQIPRHIVAVAAAGCRCGTTPYGPINLSRSIFKRTGIIDHLQTKTGGGEVVTKTRIATRIGREGTISVATRAYRAPTKPSSSTMGSLYRSEPMKLCEMILVKDAAYDCVGELGKYGNVQFNDL
ncbi:hypothetical protein ANCDUO_22573 [Ancylostoma duodenale]|uniref:Uncharacterized protein n=1 Tax=Ancylostoma duodenale TaxID=51022 RepID=A0A0C2CC18_9BILA|nr:hypothetical protein ANCDUO_22573 [Ancylostoma duodenale]